jgi:polyhydroxybutyrate depolymerase
MKFRHVLVVCAAVLIAGAAFPTTPSSAGRPACTNQPTDGYVVRSPYLDDDQEAALQSVDAIDRRPADLPRTYQLYVPAGLKRKPVPLLVTMHGLGGSGGQHAEKSELQVTADRHGFVLVSPTGARTWDNSDRALDIGFLRDVVAQVRSEYCIDARRIFASGHSNGAFMTHRLACDAADLFAAGASMAAGDVENGLQGGPCQPAGRVPPAGEEPMPLAMWHGTADSVIRYESGRLGLTKWLARYQCNTTPATTTVDAFGSTETYSGCTRPDIVALDRPDFVVVFRTLDEHNHGWGNGCGGTPTCDPAAPTRPFPTALELNEEMWSFLSAHPRVRPAA